MFIYALFPCKNKLWKNSYVICYVNKFPVLGQQIQLQQIRICYDDNELVGAIATKIICCENYIFVTAASFFSECKFQKLPKYKL